MSVTTRSVATLALLAILPVATAAQNHGQAPPPPVPRPAAPARPAVPPRPPVPPPHPAPPPQPHPAPPPPVRGFALPHDTSPQPAAPHQQAPKAPPSEHAQPPRHSVPSPVAPKAGVKPPPKNYRQAAFSGTVHTGPYWNRFHGPVIVNPRRWHGWGWNRGVVWSPAPLYWGGGFWGPFALGGLGTLSPFGWFLDDQSQQFYPSYEILQNSPGEQLLQNYGLTQTECGQPNLVVLWGPSNSVICAYPNDLVSAGDYQVDPATLTIVSMI